MSTPEPTLLSRAVSAAESGDVDQLGEILEASPEVLTARDSSGDTLLGLACRSATGDAAIPPVPGTTRQHQAVDIILEAGANPDAATADGWAPLHTAAMAGHRDLVQRLLAAGAMPRGRLLQCEGGSPLALALFYAKTGVGDLLAQPPEPDNLRHAAALGRELDAYFVGDEPNRRARVGLDFYRPFSIFPSWERSYSRQEILDEALSWAARNGQLASLATLVQRGAEVNSSAYRGTPLLWATYSDSVEAATWLLDHGADPNLRHDFGGEGHDVQAVALHLAAQIESLGCMELLLRRGADPTLMDGAHGGDAMGWAVFHGASGSIQVLENWGDGHELR